MWIQFINASKMRQNSREMHTQDKTSTMADAVSACESIHTNQNNTMSSLDNPSSKDTQLPSKPSLSYIALIAKVILSSPSQKLNLASIYRAMEEQFPYLRSRSPGWRNSVRHNLSVNDCFVKVGRCEDGRGHYWGVHGAHLKNFQRGIFRQCRTARGRRERQHCNEVAGVLAWMESRCILRRFCESRSSVCVVPQCPLQEPRRYQLSSADWTQPHYQPWSINVGWTQFPSCMKYYYFPERLPDFYDRASAWRGHISEPMTSRLHGQMYDPALTSMQESYDGKFTTTSVQAFKFPGCWCVSPVIQELNKPLT